MAQYMALMWTIKPGSEQTVEELFKKSGRPSHDIRNPAGDIVGRLLSTQVFMKDNIVLRVAEIEGDPRAWAMHMGQQEEVRELERELDKYVEKPRDMSTPQGAGKFFMESAMKLIVSRRHDDPA